jgi:hypothetical protein
MKLKARGSLSPWQSAVWGLLIFLLCSFATKSGPVELLVVRTQVFPPFEQCSGALADNVFLRCYAAIRDTFFETFLSC